MTPNKSNIGTIPIALAKKIKNKNVNISGAQLLTHLGPTFGLTIVSRTKVTTISIRFIKPDGINFFCLTNC